MSHRPHDAKKRTARVRPAQLILLSLVALLVVPAPAAAYIDPVSGSVLLQILSAAILAGAVTIGRARAWLVGLFRRGGRQASRDAE